MARCEDYPCCGHGPVSSGGDGGGCPDARGRFRCVLCGALMPPGKTSAICDRIHPREEIEAAMDSDDDSDY